MDLVIKIVFSSIEYIALILFALSSFRLPIKYHLHKITFIAVVGSIVSFYIRDVLNQSEFAVLPTLLVEIILVFLLLRLPLIFSFLICLIGNLVTATAEVFVVWVGSQFIPDYEAMLQTSITSLALFEVIIACILLLLTNYLQRRKIGYHFTQRDSLRGYNFLLSALLIIAVLLLQIEIYSFHLHYISSYVPIISGIILLLVVYYSYQHNKKLWKERRERLEKK